MKRFVQLIYQVTMRLNWITDLYFFYEHTFNCSENCELFQVWFCDCTTHVQWITLFSHDERCCRPFFCTDEAILGREATWVNDANFVMNHTSDTGSLARPGGLKPSALPTELLLLAWVMIPHKSCIHRSWCICYVPCYSTWLLNDILQFLGAYGLVVKA